MKQLARLTVLTLFLLPSAASAQLSATSTAATNASIPQGAQRVGMLEVSLQAGCDGDVRIEEIAVRHGGLGASSDITGVYISDGRSRLSPSQRFNGRSQTAILRPRNLVIPSCTERTVTIAVDFSVEAASGGEHRVTLAGIRTNTGLADIRTTQSSSSVSRAVPRTTGSISVAYLPLHTTVRYGNNRTVARFTLSADSSADQLVREIVLTNKGSAQNGDLINLELMDGRTVIGESSTLNGDTVRFTIDPAYRIGRNSTKLLTVRADVRGSIKRTIRFEVEEPSDIFAEPEQGRRQ